MTTVSAKQHFLAHLAEWKLIATCPDCQSPVTAPAFVTGKVDHCGYDVAIFEGGIMRCAVNIFQTRAAFRHRESSLDVFEIKASDILEDHKSLPALRSRPCDACIEKHRVPCVACNQRFFPTDCFPLARSLAMVCKGCARNCTQCHLFKTFGVEPKCEACRESSIAPCGKFTRNKVCATSPSVLCAFCKERTFQWDPTFLCCRACALEKVIKCQYCGIRARESKEAPNTCDACAASRSFTCPRCNNQGLKGKEGTVCETCYKDSVSCDLCGALSWKPNIFLGGICPRCKTCHMCAQPSELRRGNHSYCISCFSKLV